MTTTDNRDIPVLTHDIGTSGPVGCHFAEWDEVREHTPAFWNDVGDGHWVVTRFEAIRHALQDPSIFSNESTIIGQPEPEYKMIPTFLDPPEHTKFRQLYNARFAPAVINRITPDARAACNRSIDAIIGRGSCDFIHEFADIFPTHVFLSTMGLDLDDAPQFVIWVRDIFTGLAGGDPEPMAAAMSAVRNYFEVLVADRREHPRDPDVDTVTYLTYAKIDGAPIEHDDLLWMLMVLVLAGLDTTKSQLGFMWHHLATHPEHRHRLVEDPSLMPSAIEEYLRYYAFVPPARKLKQDVEYEGCPMKAGQMVLMPLWAATRDPRQFDRADEVVLDRSPNRHIAFGAGPHRCAGAHLARRELLIALEEWHARIPDYELDTDEAPIEHGWQLGLDSLPLRWEV